MLTRNPLERIGFFSGPKRSSKICALKIRAFAWPHADCDGERQLCDQNQEERLQERLRTWKTAHNPRCQGSCQIVPAKEIP